MRGSLSLVDRKRFPFLRLLIGLGAIAALPAWAQNFTVVAASGGAYVGPGAEPTQAAVVNSSHPIPSWGRTDDNSTLTIAFNGENSFRLLPGSEAEVKVGDDNSSSSWHRVVSLKIGSASLDHHKGTAPAVNLDCETPTAICGAVGTEFEVNATEGTYSVSSGLISVHSDSEGNNLNLANIQSGGRVTFNPGRENTYSKADFSGSVYIDGRAFTASGADFTVAKKEGSSAETAVHIASGSLSGTGEGNYLMEGGKLVPVIPAKQTLHAQYLAAAGREGALNVEIAANRAAGRGTGGLGGKLSAAASEATTLREQLFNRETVREVNKKVTEEIINSTTRSAVDAARNAMGH